MSASSLRSIFVNNRAEQLPPDIWQQFVVPAHFNKIDLGNDRKSVLIEGGRGCGKTMFIRYYCHNTLFSKNRDQIPDDELGNIGIYWKPHVKYCAFLEKPSWIPNEFKERTFQHYAALEILEDFYNALESIENADLANGAISLLNREIPAAIAVYFQNQVGCYSDLQNFLKAEKVKLDIWTKNPQFTPPIFIQFDQILKLLAEDLACSDPRLSNLFFRVFIDEYENLQPKQQQFLNDYIKHPEKRFCVNIATRRNSTFCTQTSGFERIVEIHDYRRVDLEAEFLSQKGRSSFSLLAAEVLILRLKQAGYQFSDMPDTTAMFDRSRIDERQSPSYQEAVRGFARKLFPHNTGSEIAADVFNDQALTRRLRKLIEKGLKKHSEKKYSIEDFIKPEKPEASIVAACILNRDRTNVELLYQELVKELDVGASKFSTEGEWVGTNLYGALYYLYIGLPQRPCLLYSGFDRFCQIARSNLRYFQELCYESFVIFESDYPSELSDGTEFTIPCRVQAEAAKIASGKLLINVADFGNDLLHLVRNLGKIFQLAQKRAGQSEPEVNHFSISGTFELHDRAKVDDVLSRAKVWSILYEDKDTKNKNSGDLESVDYVPNPIYSPYFCISYRKKRKISFTAQEFLDILEGNEDKFKEIERKYEKKWGFTEEERNVQGEIF